MKFAIYLFKKVFLSLGTLVVVSMFAYLFLFSLIEKEKSLSQSFISFFKNIFNGFGLIRNSSLRIEYNSNLNLFLNHLQYTFIFILFSLLVASFLGLFLGILFGLNSNKKSSIIFSFLIFIITSLPIFILAPIFILIAQNNDLPIIFLKPNEYGLFWSFLSLIFPVVLLSLVPLTYIFISTKNLIMQSFLEEYIIQMKALGLSNWLILKKALLRNIFANYFANLLNVVLITLGISFILERIFDIPGESLFLINMFDLKEVEAIITFIILNISFLLSLNIISQLLYIYLANLIKETNIDEYTSSIRIRKIVRKKYETFRR
ncbi:ABC transporter permease subunit [Mycoplasmopsis meleagridis]|uniref:ABC transporter permease subunit n=1 Tax=Mycoplasmopsis meleagridis TaxID=29561 RepID=UPI003A86FA27